MNESEALADQARRRLGFLSHAETAALAHRGVLLPFPDSVLVSQEVQVGEGVVLWPNVILQAQEGGGIVIGPETRIFPGTRIVASGGAVRIGALAEIGEEGGFTIKAGPGAIIEIGDGARLLGGGSLSQTNRIGRGAQVLGPIRCQNCTLGGGGSHRDPDPDARGGVLKGAGVARNIDIPTGSVIQAFGLFSEGIVRPQSYFHPKSGG
jgi:bifunctional N-acetylglucosamine-1-phosphate-uridyltransferase/glucosamine-1-phosphate-acetyltransferase GlmU-like protein